MKALPAHTGSVRPQGEQGLAGPRDLLDQETLPGSDNISQSITRASIQAPGASGQIQFTP